MKRILALLLAAVMALSLAACGSDGNGGNAGNDGNAGNNGNGAPVQGTEGEDGGSAAVTYPLTLTDMAGREVTLEAEPERIVSGYYISSSACLALGLADRMVGVEDKSDSRPIYSLAAPELIELPNVGSAKAFDLETCIAAEPDLVILPMQQQDTADTLAGMGIPAIVVLPESHEQILEMFTLLGTAANVTDAAQALIDYYSEKLDQVESLTADLADDAKPVVYLGGTSSYLTTAPAQMYQASLITSAGGVNAGSGIDGTSWVDISYEQLLTMNPDIIVIPTNNFATSAPEYTAEDILADPQLSEVTAVKNGAVYQMTTGFEAWDSPCPSGILGTLWMLKTLHPDLYSSESFAADAQDFYETFYGFTPDAEALAQ